MKKGLVLSAFLLTSIFAKTEVSLNLGTNSFASSEILDSATSLGVRGDFYLDDLYHIDLGYDNLGNVQIEKLNNKLKIDRFYTQFSADGEEEYHVVPTMSVGVGYERQKGDLSDSQPFISAGINFRYNLSNNLNFLLGSKALWKTSSRDINFHSTVGIGYLFGEEPINNEDKQEEIKIPEKKLDISTQFSPKEVTQVVPIPKVVPVQADVKEIAVEKISPKIPTKIKPVQTLQSRGYFIQVGAYSKNQPIKLLTKLSKEGNHIVLRHQQNITKALVGPYSSEEKARKNLVNIRRYAKGAFIYKEN